MASCTYVAQYSSSKWETDNPYCHVGTQGTSNYYASMIKFTTPSFIGRSKKIEFKLAIAATSTTTAYLRYAIATSDKNKNSYTKTYGAVSDAYQIVDGTVNISATTQIGYKTISIETDKLNSNTTYYLFLWSDRDGNSNSSVTIQPQGMTISGSNKVNHTITITIDDAGIVYIDNGTTFEAYYVYIDNGSGWDRYIPYIDNGSGWDLYG